MVENLENHENIEEEQEHTYELWLHWKQGDDFKDCLEEAKGDVSAALELWAKEFDACAQRCRALAIEVKNKDIQADGDTHMISFYGDELVLEELVKKELLQRIDL